jgi:hypothetical protein
MKINIIATGSSGNLYEIVDNSGNSILIEAGMSRSYYIANKIGEKAPEMCIISHLHMDHAHFKGEFQAMIPVYVSEKNSTSENFKAYGIDLKHGDGKSTTFIIKSLVENKFLFFGTDIEFSKDYDELYNALIELKVDNFLIECNYNDYLFHLATPEQRVGCSRHFSDNDVVNFMRIVAPKNPKIILIHGSNRLCVNDYAKKYIDAKLLKHGINAIVDIAIGYKEIIIEGKKQGVKNTFTI